MRKTTLANPPNSSTPQPRNVCFRCGKQRPLLAVTLAFGVLAGTASVQAQAISWIGTGGDTLWSSGVNWAPGTAPGTTANVRFAADGVTDNPYALGGTVNNLVDGLFSSGINSLAYVNIAGFHNTSVTGTLAVNSDSATDVANVADDGEASVFFVGSGALNGKDDSVYASILGNVLTVTNRNANVSVSQISQVAGLHRATLDMRELNTFSAAVAKVLVGHNFTQPDFAWRPTGELFLAKTNLISAGVISLSDAYQNAGAACFIHLGWANTLNVDNIRIGMHKCVGSIDVTPGVINPSVTFRNAAGTGRQLSWQLGDEYESRTNLLFGFFTSNQARGTMDLTGASVDAMVDEIVLGRGQIQRDAIVRNGDGNGTLIFGGGTIDANSIQMGIQVPGPFIGGSVGNGILTVNNDPGVGPALLNVHNNVLMTVQQPGNTDPNGSTAVITINNGSTMAVAGDILDGGGTSTINLNNNGLLDMQPAGDGTPGNVTVDVLNISDGILANFGTLSVSAINLLGVNQEFLVAEFQAIAPAGLNAVGQLSVSGSLTLRGDTFLDIRKTGTTLDSDLVTATGIVDLGGTLRVIFHGDTPLAEGDKFTLFAGLPLDSAATVVLPPPGSGLAWANNILIDGTIQVIACGCGEPTTPPTLTISSTPAAITVSWPSAYTSFALRGQTNTLSKALGTNWGVVPGVVNNQKTFPRATLDGAAYFQLFQQP